MLYLHGFIDYFFQSHLADAFNGAGCNFYALDLRKYGRSLGQASHPNFCKDFEEYFPEITSAIDIITTVEHHDAVIAERPFHRRARCRALREDRRSPRSGDPPDPQQPLSRGATGTRCCRISVRSSGGLFPSGASRNPSIRGTRRAFTPTSRASGASTRTGNRSTGFDAFYGWLRAVVRVQDRIKKGLGLEQPVLVMHSDRSEKGKTWSDTFHRADLVLDVTDIKRLSPHLGTRTELQEIAGGKHDLVLSCEDARAECLRVMLEWIAKPVADTSGP